MLSPRTSQDLMLGGDIFQGFNPDCDGEFQASHTSVIDARKLKIQVKGSGHRLSANAFDELNMFVRQLGLAIVMASARLAEPPMDGCTENIPWSVVMGGVKQLVPSLEGWFSSCYSQLVNHVETAHDGQLPEDLPCCSESSDSTSLLCCDKIIAELRAILLRSHHTINWYAMGALCYGLNETLQWVMQVSLKMMDAKGVGTLRKADVQGIIEKAPIFAGLLTHLQAVLPLCSVNMPSVPIKQSRQAHGSPLITDFTMNNGHSPKMGDEKVAKEMSVTELAKLVSERLSPAIPKPEPKRANPVLAQPEQRQAGSRYVVCTDRSFPWVRVDSGERATMVQSTGVQTDACYDHDAEESLRLREEVTTLKQLVATLLQHKHV